MLEIICLIILIASLVALLIMMVLKIPALVELPETEAPPFDWKETLSQARTQIKKTPPLKQISFGLLLQKILSRFRVLILKTDNKTSNWLQHLRENSQDKKFGEDDHYWQEIKKSTKKDK